MMLMRRDKKVPKNFSRRDCYQRIYEWHKEFGERRLKEKRQKEDTYSKAYLALLKKLPHPDTVSEECMDFIFGEVIYGLMEWSYHEVDKFGIKIAAYAHSAINQKYYGINDDNFRKSTKKCSLYKKFAEWKERYEG